MSRDGVGRLGLLENSTVVGVNCVLRAHNGD